MQEVKRLPGLLLLGFLLAGCGTNGTPDTTELSTYEVFISQIDWSDGDSGRLGGVPFRLRDVDAPETGGVGAAIGGAECERERKLGFLAKVFVVTLTGSAAIVVTQNYGPDRFDRNVVDLSADGIDVASAGLEAGHFKPWPHDATGNSLSG